MSLTKVYRSFCHGRLHTATISLGWLIACQGHGIPSHRRRDNADSTYSANASQAASLPAPLRTSVSGAGTPVRGHNAPYGPTVSECEGSAQADATSATRLTAGILACAPGMKPKGDPIRWTIPDVSQRLVLRLDTPPGHCIRVAIAMEGLGPSAQVWLETEEGELLASASGRNFILVPSDGPLCLALGVPLSVQLESRLTRAAGLVVLLEPN